MRTKYKFIVLVLLAFIFSIAIYYLVERVKPVLESPTLIEVQTELEQYFLSDTSYEFDEPKVILNPYGISPLSALIIFETKDLTTPSITVQGKTIDTTYTKTYKANKTHILPIYGLYPDYNNTITLKVSGKTKTINIQTSPLPENIFSPTNIKKNRLDDKLYFVLSEDSYPVAYDTNGDIRWYLTKIFSWNLKRLNNGRLMMGSNRMIDNTSVGLVEIDLLGKVYYEYIIPDGFHNDFYELPDGNLLVCINKNNMIEDSIVEIDRKTGSIIKTIDLNNIFNDQTLNNNDIKYNNAILYDEINNSIIISSKNKNTIINLDYNTLNLNWVAGNENSILKPIDNKIWSSLSSMLITPDDNLMILDAEMKFNQSYLSLYSYNLDNMTIKQIWQSKKIQGISESTNISYLNNNYYLIHTGNTITEILNNNEIFNMELPLNNYKVEKLSLYSNDEFISTNGITLGQLNKTNTIRNKLLLFNKNADNIITKYNISLYKENDRLVINGTFNKNDKVEIILDNIFLNKTYSFDTSKDIKYINTNGLKGKYYIFFRINNKLYDFDQYVEFYDYSNNS